MNVEPIRPVPAELEKVVEVDKAETLEIGRELAERILVVNRPNGDELTLDTELVLGEAEPLVDGGAREGAPFVRFAPNENRRGAYGDGNGHRWADAMGGGR
jgi:hypothetical protein